MDLGQNFVCDRSRGSPSSGVGSCGFLSSDVLDKWFSVCWYWPCDQQVVCLVVFGLFGDFGSSGKVCQVALGQEVVGLVVVRLLVFVQEVVCLECWVI